MPQRESQQHYKCTKNGPNSKWKTTNNAAGGVEQLSSKWAIQCFMVKQKPDNVSWCPVDNEAHSLHQHCDLGRQLSSLSLSLLPYSMYKVIITFSKDCCAMMQDDVCEKVQCPPRGDPSMISCLNSSLISPNAWWEVPHRSPNVPHHCHKPASALVPYWCQWFCTISPGIRVEHHFWCLPAT